MQRIYPLIGESAIVILKQRDKPIEGAGLTRYAIAPPRHGWEAKLLHPIAVRAGLRRRTVAVRQRHGHGHHGRRRGASDSGSCSFLSSPAQGLYGTLSGQISGSAGNCWSYGYTENYSLQPSGSWSVAGGTGGFSGSAFNSWSGAGSGSGSWPITNGTYSGSCQESGGQSNSVSYSATATLPAAASQCQTNLSEYCGNNPTNYTDPSGMVYITHPYRGPSPAQNRQAFVNAIAPPNRDWLDNTSDFGAGFVDTMPMSGTWFMRQKANNNGRLGGQVNCNSWYYFLGKVAGIADTVGIALLSGTSGGGTPVRQNPQPVPPPVTPELPPVAPDVPLVSPEAPARNRLYHQVVRWCEIQVPGSGYPTSPHPRHRLRNVLLIGCRRPGLRRLRRIRSNLAREYDGTAEYQRRYSSNVVASIC